jgi:hypothetical protein
MNTKPSVEELTKSFDCELGEILVSYEKKTIHNPPRQEVFHGVHYFNEDEVEYLLISVEIVIKGKGIDIIGQLNKEQRILIENLLEQD